jgi:hypothetical protein
MSGRIIEFIFVRNFQFSLRPSLLAGSFRTITIAMQRASPTMMSGSQGLRSEREHPGANKQFPLLGARKGKLTGLFESRQLCGGHLLHVRADEGNNRSRHFTVVSGSRFRISYARYAPLGAQTALTIVLMEVLLQQAGRGERARSLHRAYRGEGVFDWIVDFSNLARRRKFVRRDAAESTSYQDVTGKR